MKNKTLSSLVGSVDEAGKLYSLAAQYRLAEEQNDKQQIDELGEQLDAAFAQASGEIFATLRQSQAYSFEKATLAEATGKRFAGQLKAYRAAKDIYIRLQRLSAFEEALEKIRKYVVVADTSDTQVFIIDVQEKLTPSIYDLPGIVETKKK
jgi:mRNA degradation ribonuclease J1/J2